MAAVEGGSSGWGFASGDTYVPAHCSDGGEESLKVVYVASVEWGGHSD